MEGFIIVTLNRKQNGEAIRDKQGSPHETYGKGRAKRKEQFPPLFPCFSANFSACLMGNWDPVEEGPSGPPQNLLHWSLGMGRKPKTVGGGGVSEHTPVPILLQLFLCGSVDTLGNPNSSPSGSMWAKESQHTQYRI